MSEDEIMRKGLSEISTKMNVLISLSLRQLIGDKEFHNSGKRKQRIGEQARYLAAMGLESRDIAKIIGAPLSSVRTLLTPSRKR